LTEVNLNNILEIMNEGEVIGLTKTLRTSTVAMQYPDDARRVL
jgi:hypothetical protein